MLLKTCLKPGFLSLGCYC